MHAIVLAAGVGSRLRPETDQTPKCMLRVGHETFLSRLLRQYYESGVESITVVGGYRVRDVAEHIRQVGFPVRLVENRLFDCTNNMFSLALGLNPLEGDVLFGNADVVYEDSLIEAFVKTAQPNSIPVEVGAYLDESMKVEAAPDGRIIRISKQIGREAALGNSLDVYKLSASAARSLRDLIVSDYLLRGRLKEWSEVALNDLLANEPFQVWDTGSRWWVEVDTLQDLAEARRLVRDAASEGDSSKGSVT